MSIGTGAQLSSVAPAQHAVPGPAVPSHGPRQGPPPEGDAPRLQDLEHRRRSVVAAARNPPGAGRRPSGTASSTPERLTARQRIAALLDPDTFVELQLLRRSERVENPRATDGVLCGHGTVFGQPVAVFAQDFAVLGGTLGVAHVAKIRRLVERAVRIGVPVVGLYDGGGARIQEGAVALDACGRLFAAQVAASGRVPQISAVLGPCAGAAAYAPALSDFVFMVEGVGQMYLTGPDVVRSVTAEDVTAETLGGARVHATRSGAATFSHPDEASCLEDVRYLISLLPPSKNASPWRSRPEVPVDRDGSRIQDLVPGDPRRAYDMVELMEEIVDPSTFLELHAQWAPSIVCGLARLNGRVVGLVGNQPLHLAGAITADASQKAARFVRTCDVFNIPIVTLVDVPGFLPGTDQELGGIIRHGAKLLYAYASATVPRIQLILRKAYGGGYIVMDSVSLGADLAFAWPSNQVAVMGEGPAVEIVHRRRLAASEDREATFEQLKAEYAATHLHPFVAAEAGLVDDVIDPARTRTVLDTALTLLEGKDPSPHRKRSGNHPT